jgi:hypothetical protein
MAEHALDVNLLSLEDFHRSLDARIAQVDHLLRQIDELACRNVPLGRFPDATAQVSRHGEFERGFAERLRALHTATEAAKQATAAILANYRSAEERNAANAKDIAGALGGVTNALRGS